MLGGSSSPTAVKRSCKSGEQKETSLLCRQGDVQGDGAGGRKVFTHFHTSLFLGVRAIQEGSIDFPPFHLGRSVYHFLQFVCNAPCTKLFLLLPSCPSQSRMCGLC